MRRRRVSKDPLSIFPRGQSTRNSFQKKKIRNALYYKYKGQCSICKQCVPFEEVTIEHVVPLSKGGTWAMPNLRIAHKDCNQDKGDLTQVEYELNQH